MRRQSTPLLVPAHSNLPQALRRRDMRGRAFGGYDEAWIQNMIHQSPSILPIADVEPAMQPLIAVCTELPLRSGYLDNLLVTPFGDLIAVECKLWRNAEARREVLAQVLDYAKALQGLSYEMLEQAIRSALSNPSFGLFDHVSQTSGEPEAPLTEADFIDTVSRNLRRGRFLLVIAGDGITESLEDLATVLQQHAGMHFSLLLAQLAVYEMPEGGGAIIVPSIPLKTETILRGIVHVEDGQTKISPPPANSAVRQTQPLSLTAEEIFASLDAIRPGISARLIEFLNDCQDLQVSWQVKRSVAVRMEVGGRRVPFMVVMPNGEVDTGYAFNMKPQMKVFIDPLVSAVPGLQARDTPKVYYARRTDGRLPLIWDLLDHSGQLRAAIALLNHALVDEASE